MREASEPDILSEELLLVLDDDILMICESILLSL